MNFGQTLWGNLSITLLMTVIPLLPVLFFLAVFYFNRQAFRILANPSPLLLANITLVGLSLFGLACFAIFSLPYSTISNLAVSLSPDHSLASLNESIYTSASLVMRLMGAVCLALAVWLRLLLRRYLGWLYDLLTICAQASCALVRDIRLFIAALQQELPSPTTRDGRMEWLLLAGLTLVAAGLRVVYFDKPFYHDEAYTYVGFASRTLRAVVTDYSLPNNHVLHTILVWISVQIFGPTPWAIRLPAFVAGVLCVPAAYFLARRMYNRSSAILAAVMVAAIPDLITRSTDARGYMQMALFTLIILWLGDQVRQKPNRLAWLLLVVFSSLGFYTLPTMLFPFGGLLAWLTLSALAGEIGSCYRSRWHFIAAIFTLGLATVLSTLLLYSTILIGSGPAAFFGNPFVKSLDWDIFTALLPLRWSDLAHDWNSGIPFDGWLALTGLLVVLLFNKKLARQWIPWMATMLVWIGFNLVLQRPDPMSRLWTFLLPPLLISVAAGWDAILRRIQSLLPAGWQKWPLQQVITAAVVLLFLASATTLSATFYINGGANPGPVENMVTTLGGQLQKGDWAMSVSVYEPPLWYYFRLHNIPWSYLDSPKDGIARRYVVIVFGDEKETVESILQKRKVAAGQAHLDQMQLIQDKNNIKVYLIPGTSTP